VRRAGAIVRTGWPIAALLLLAAVSAAVARDAAALHRTFERSDLAFKAQPYAGGLWKADTRLPFVERAFAVEEDLDYRRALRAFAVDARRRDNPYDFDRPAFRADAQATLSAAERSELEPALRSKAASLQGILVFDEAVADPVNGPALVGRSIADFRRAVGIDPGNEEAKYNLEFVLRLMEPSAERLRIRENIPAYRTGRSAPGAAPPRRGHGY
jgi:hypothetical protein